jgi:hypothetical protein
MLARQAGPTTRPTVGPLELPTAPRLLHIRAARHSSAARHSADGSSVSGRRGRSQPAELISTGHRRADRSLPLASASVGLTSSSDVTGFTWNHATSRRQDTGRRTAKRRVDTRHREEPTISRIAGSASAGLPRGHIATTSPSCHRDGRATSSSHRADQRDRFYERRPR